VSESEDDIFDPGEDTSKDSGITPPESPKREPFFADPDEDDEHIPGEVIQYPSPRPPIINPPVGGDPFPPAPPPIRISGGSGEGLSPEDRIKLDGIEPNAEVNVQSDWVVSDENSDAFIKNKPDLSSLGGGVLSDDSILDLAKPTRNSSDRGKPLGTSPDNENDLVFLDSIEGESLSPEDRIKLDGIQDGAEVNIQSDWNESDQNSDSYIQNKPTVLRGEKGDPGMDSTVPGPRGEKGEKGDPGIDATPVIANPTFDNSVPILESISIGGVIYRLAVSTTIPDMGFRSLFGFSDDMIPEDDEFGSQKRDNQDTLESYSGSKHLIFAREATASDPMSLFFSDAENNPPINQIGAFSKSSPKTIDGISYNIWISNQLVTQPERVTISISDIRSEIGV